MYIHNRSRATASLRALLYQDRLKFSSDFGRGGGTSGRATAISPRGPGSNPGSDSYIFVSDSINLFLLGTGLW